MSQGADIPDINQVIQFGIPKSLSIWIQRAGRAGHSPHINACAILLVEKSMFQWRKKRQKPGAEEEDDGGVSGESDADEESSEDEIGGDSEKMECGKKVEPELRRWIETEDCR
jgi:superfamily II DNA helicase RecQ